MAGPMVRMIFFDEKWFRWGGELVKGLGRKEDQLLGCEPSS